MVKRTPISPSAFPVIAATDQAASAHIERALVATGFSQVSHVRMTRGWKGAGTLVEKVGVGRLLVAADAEISRELLAAVGTIVNAGGFVGVWTGISENPCFAPSDSWIGEQLLFQAGAILCPYPAPLAVAARLHAAAKRKTFDGINVRGKKNAVLKRLEAFLVAEGFNTGSSKTGLTFSVDEIGNILLVDTDISRPLGDPKVVAEAAGMFLRNRFDFGAKNEAVQVDRDDVDLIAQPPPRLLSETASKKLLAAYGLSLPFEQLCQSPSEAARVAGAMTGPSVMKLVKPRLENKQDAGAVILGVEGTSGVRRAAQVLESLGVSMGPPPSLGVLVADRIAGGLRISVRMEIHPRFGRLLLVTKGDKIDTPPLVAFRAPVTADRVCVALLHANLSSDKIKVQKIAVALSKLSVLVADLKGRINRVEIHPLVAVDTHPEALVLDALAAVGPD